MKIYNLTLALKAINNNPQFDHFPYKTKREENVIVVLKDAENIYDHIHVHYNKNDIEATIVLKELLQIIK